MKLTAHYQTIATVGYSGSVSVDDYNPAAHGAVCHLQARRAPNGRIMGRRINTNGRHSEVGDGFEIDESTLAEWLGIERCSR